MTVAACDRSPDDLLGAAHKGLAPDVSGHEVDKLVRHSNPAEQGIRQQLKGLRARMWVGMMLTNWSGTAVLQSRESTSSWKACLGTEPKAQSVL